MDLINIILDICGILISFWFIWLTIKASRTLVGSFFKKYYKLMTVVAVVFGSGFLVEAIGEIFPINPMLTDVIHHALLIIAAIMFVYAGIAFVKEAAVLTGNE